MISEDSRIITEVQKALGRLLTTAGTKASK